MQRPLALRAAVPLLIWACCWSHGLAFRIEAGDIDNLEQDGMHIIRPILRESAFTSERVIFYGYADLYPPDDKNVEDSLWFGQVLQRKR